MRTLILLLLEVCAGAAWMRGQPRTLVTWVLAIKNNNSEEMLESKKQRDPIPESFASIEEAAEFWDKPKSV